MTEYGTLLRRLVDFTGSKLYAVADEVGYDVSYISKWCNKDLLPAPKTAHTVNVALGRFFGDAIRIFRRNRRAECGGKKAADVDDVLKGKRKDVFHGIFSSCHKQK